ncbi:hypothetical protein HN011_009745 [Eciton burchellii]|nr:hypothetical protein HN011_009745 [Eciton burchellii]
MTFEDHFANEVDELKYHSKEGLKNAEIFNQAETTETGIRYLWHLCAVIYRTPHRLVHVAKTLRTVGRKT